jgi:tRNA threonylcarbamoyladenosine biosynthesis protein TsaB
VILGFDTATADTAVAVMDGATTVHEAAVGPEPGGRPAHGLALLGLIDTAVREAGGWESVERIAVGLGPGSFTGLRIGVSTSRALAQARGIPLVGVSSTAALVAGLAELHGGAGGPLIGVIDARRGEVFAAIDRGEGAGEPIVCLPGALAVALGGELEHALAAGEGAVRFRSEIEASRIEVPADDDPAHRLSARQVCLLGARIDPGGSRPPNELTPNYMRRPDAERWLERNDGN